MATIITTKTSTCADNYSLFAKDNPFYGIPYLDRSRSSIPSDTSSFLGKARSPYDREGDYERSTLSLLGNQPAPLPAPTQHSGSPTRTRSSTHLVPPAVIVEPPAEDETRTLADYEDAVNLEIGTISPDVASFVTASSLPHSAGETCIVQCGSGSGKGPYVFHRWMKTMFRKSGDESRVSSELRPHSQAGTAVSSRSARTGTTTLGSSHMITAVKTASITLASFPLSAGTHSHSRRKSAGAFDKQTLDRMIERQHALEELITTEEYYIRDLKSLKNQYLPILREYVWVSAEMKQSLLRNVQEMIDLHERLLGEIVRALPCVSQMIHLRGFDASPRIGSMVRNSLLGEPAASAEVAKIFETTIMGFFVYEEYAAKYEDVVRAPKHPGKTDNPIHGKGTESLIAAANSWDNRDEYGKRALELSDMLCKPVQRLCKYPLLFRDIEKNTPAIDCPNTNRLLEKIRHRLDEQVHQVNMANGDVQKTRERIEKTWRLQDRLDFHKADLPARLLGHIVLCGTLHATWRSNRESHPRAEYMACMLFKSHLIFASTPKPDHYKIRFAITLALARIEECDEGRGLFSPGAPCTWKIVFEADHKIYEILCSAASENEEFIWRTHLQDRITAETKDFQEYSIPNLDFCACMSSDIKPICGAGRPGTLARHRLLMANAPESVLGSRCQYIVINSMLSSSDPSGGDTITKSVASASSKQSGAVPTINLKRSERNRVESRLADVWTKDVLPFGTTQPQKSKEPNAATIMKRLSTLSILTTGGKKPTQSVVCGLADTPDDDAADEQTCVSGRSGKLSNRSSKPSSKASSRKSAPPSPTKRSSSLSSKFSFASSGRKEPSSVQEQSGSTNSKKRGLRPILDSKWKSVVLPSGDPAMLEYVTSGSATHRSGKRRSGKIRGSVASLKPPTPTDSFQYVGGEDTTHRSRDEYLMAEKDGNGHSNNHSASASSMDVSRGERPGLLRRHTVILPPRSSSPRSWMKTMKSKKAKTTDSLPNYDKPLPPIPSNVEPE